MSAPSVLDLFCGAGGLAEGFRQAGFRVAAGTDHDPDACATFALNFPEALTVCGDIRQGDIHRAAISAGSGVDVIVGGPPCQAFSQVRNHVRLIDDPRNSLYREFVEIVAVISPTVFVMENVPGLAQMGVKQQVLEDLQLDGRYHVRVQLLDAADFGVPQTRKRIVFTGIRADLALDAPTITGSGATACLEISRRTNHGGVNHVVAASRLARTDWLDRLFDPEDVSVVTAQQAIGDLEMLGMGARAEERDLAELDAPASAYQRLMRRGLERRISNVSVPRTNADTVLRLEAIPQGGNHRDLTESLRERYLTGLRWGPAAGTGKLSRRHYYAYRRLHPGFWSWTLNTKGDSVYHYGEPRALSVREFARLQSFPDRFVFTTDPRRGPLPGRIVGGAAHSRYRQAGNAVPPFLARAIAVVVKQLLDAAARPVQRVALG